MDKTLDSRMTPCVSIVILTYNRASLLIEAIQSALGQTFSDFEIIIIDDASSDNTLEIVTPYLSDHRIQYIQNSQNKGIAISRNFGISIAKGEYIAMLDSDDVWLDRNKLTAQVSYLKMNSDCEVVGTWMIQINELGQHLKKISFAQTDTDIRKSILYRNHIAHSSVLFRKNTALNVGGYDEALKTMEDHDLWLRLGSYGKFATLPIYSLGYRIHNGSISKTKVTRVAMDELAVVWRHRNHYQGIIKGMIKANARIIKSVLF